MVNETIYEAVNDAVYEAVSEALNDAVNNALNDVGLRMNIVKFIKFMTACFSYAAGIFCV